MSSVPNTVSSEQYKSLKNKAEKDALVKEKECHKQLLLNSTSQSY